jgi:F420-non-reducing hydrogenase iron-sulfur subunit
MSTNGTKIVGFCCHYTSMVSEDALQMAGLLPAGVRFKHVPCTGRVEVPALLAAFEQGADAVFVVGCEEGSCHNLSGSQQAAKRVGQARAILKEFNVRPERIEMFFVTRGETELVVAAAREMSERAGSLGPLYGEQAKVVEEVQ